MVQGCLTHLLLLRCGCAVTVPVTGVIACMMCVYLFVGWVVGFVSTCCQVPLRCSVEHISFSAHADYTQTSSFLDALQPPHVVLVHGEVSEMMRLKKVGWVTDALCRTDFRTATCVAVDHTAQAVWHQ